MIRRALVLVVLVGISVVAILSAVQAGFEPGGSEVEESDRRALEGPAVPAPGFLPGTIRVATTEGCSAIELATVEEVRLRQPGQCDSSASAQSLRSPSLVLASGIELDEDDFRQGLSGTNSEPIAVLGHDQRADGVTAVVIERRAGVLLRERFEDEKEPLPIGSRESFAAAVANSHGGSLPEVVIQLWQSDALVGTVPIPTVGVYPVAGHALGEIVSFSPNGLELIVASGGEEGRLFLVDVSTGRPVLGPVRQREFAWSPDGIWLALADEDGIDILDMTRSEPVYVLPVEAVSLSWE